MIANDLGFLNWSSMAAIFLILTIILFSIAMGLYIYCLILKKRPISYFDIKEYSKNGMMLAKITLFIWNASIASAIINAALIFGQYLTEMGV